ncbi:MAG: UDP-glucose--hexose-1-phosphate uridylyltransferase [Defluviitaleaceae bacterium]|nr:UDP-glucose--hexose-1-phosphate uridylyltransferase [Defluviitaleaceae bacterium]
MNNSSLQNIENLLKFAVSKKLLKTEDIILARNQLYALLKLQPADKAIVLDSFYKPPKTAAKILTAITNDYAQRGHLPEDTITMRDLLETAIMGILTPTQSLISEIFTKDKLLSSQNATDKFYDICRAANYIQVDRVKKDIRWTAETEYGELQLTINLSKPEKDPKDIEAARLQPSATYPKCMLCLENVGFAGNRTYPARQNLRVVPVTLQDENLQKEQWYFQYSPYSYYNEHCIVLSEKHKPMTITAATFARLIDFVQQFPHYFIGSNADLPIVGGSILSHEHFQGGRHVFPMQLAKIYRLYKNDQYPNVQIGLVKWPLSVIRLIIANKTPENLQSLISCAADILTTWRNYSAGEIVAFSGDVPHNTITPIARMNGDQLELDLVLRNNRTSDRHPLGIFHPHAEWHHVKKENIGLIEVMGLAVLPPRIKTILEENQLTQSEIAIIFLNVLDDCGVFKQTDKGRGRFNRFMHSIEGVEMV